MTKILLCYSRKEDVPEGIEFLESNKFLFWGKNLRGNLSRPPPYEIYLAFKGSDQVKAVGKAIRTQRKPDIKFMPENWDEHSKPDKYNSYFILVELKKAYIKMKEIDPNMNRWPQDFKYLD
jgi:hypothetical protein